MGEVQHCAIIISSDCNYNDVINNLLNKTLQPYEINFPAGIGALYSSITINNLIAEEVQHEKIEITTEANSNLKSMSSGEQKKALLHHILLKKPAFIIVENIFDNLDIAAQHHIRLELNRQAAHRSILQIISRKKDILPFIKTVVTIASNKVLKVQAVDAFMRMQTDTDVDLKLLPPALHTYKLPAGPLVQLKNVAVSYNNRSILKNISWTINAGEFWQLSGPNGSGKSTILSLITGDNPKGYGQNIILFGMKKGSGETVWDIKKHIGYLTPNMTQFFPRLDSVENMVLSGFYDSVGLYTKPGELQIKIAGDWLKLINLYDQKNTPFCFLPLGKQLMALVARAMVKHPPLLILDEPTSGLDDSSIKIFTALINKIAAESSTAILYVSHQKEEGLNPQFTFQLLPGDTGSTGSIQ